MFLIFFFFFFFYNLDLHLVILLKNMGVMNGLRM